jgi:cytidine deaminase
MKKPDPLFEAARAARERAYSPYSKIKVGAAIRTTDGKVYSGCNVENSSYGATVCAERVAIQTAVAAQGTFQIAEVFVVTDATPPWAPCGLCRQVIAEFSDGFEIPIHKANLAGDVKTTHFRELFPDAFTPAHVLKK